MLSTWIRVILILCYSYATLGSNLLNTGGIVPVSKFGSKSYYFSNTFKVNFLSANQICHELGMRLVSIPTKEVNDFLYQTLNAANQDTRYWTSGTNLVDGKTWVWISTTKPVIYTNWLPGQPNSQPDAVPERCIEVNLLKNMNLKWNNLDCNALLSFICESPDVDGKGIVVANNWQGVFADPSVSPNFPVFNYNKKSYYIGNQVPLPYLDADRFCKLIGMELVSIESKEENNVIYKYIRDTIAGMAFWSGGSSLIDGINWYWLPYGKKVVYTNWLKGQPNNKNEKCIQLQFQKDDGLFWNDLNCALPQFFICEALTEKIARCPVVDSSEKLVIKNQYPVVPAVPYYHIGKEKVTYAHALKNCNDLGLKLVSIQNNAKQFAVTNAIENSGVKNVWLWTSGNKIEDKKTWRWLSGEVITKFFWNAERHQVKPMEDCVSIMEKDGVSHWYKMPCNNQHYYICESSEVINSCFNQPNFINVFVDNNAVDVRVV